MIDILWVTTPTRFINLSVNNAIIIRAFATTNLREQRLELVLDLALAG